MNHMDPSVMVFFTLKNLKTGETTPVYFFKRDPSTYPQALPREEADSIPFSLKQVNTTQMKTTKTKKAKNCQSNKRNFSKGQDKTKHAKKARQKTTRVFLLLILKLLMDVLSFTIVVKYLTFLLLTFFCFYSNTLTIIFLTLINLSIKI